MTKQEAHALLNACKAGFPASEETITQALMLTGDLSRPKPQKPDFQFWPVATFLNRGVRVMKEPQ